MQCCVITVYRMLSATLAKMDGLSKKEAPSLISPALPLKKNPGWKTSLHGPTPEIHLETSLSKMGEVLRGREEKRIPPPSKPCCCSTPFPLAKEAGQQGGKKLKKLGKGKYISVTIAMLVFWDTHRAPDSGGHLLSHFLKTADGLMQSIKSLQPESSHRQEWAELHCQQVQTDGMGRCALTSFLRVFLNWEHWKVSSWEWGRGWTASVPGKLKHTEQMAKLVYP